MRTFQLGDEAFAALAAGRPDAATVALLRRAQISRHLLLLSELVRLPGGKIPSWYANPATRDDGLADPMAALHTAALLSALRRPQPGHTDPGTATITPATAPATPSTAPATSGITLAAPGPAPAVAPAAVVSADRIVSRRYLSATHGGLTLRVRLEDTDPLRARLGLTPSRQVTAAEAERWQHLLSTAWRILTSRHRPAAEILAAVLTVIVPIEPDPGSSGLSATSADAFGAVALSTPADPLALAVGLLHEAQHSLLNATRTLFDLLGPAPVTYSPWRDDPRPPFGLLHGAYAYQAVTRFWRTEAALPGGGRPAEFEFARWRAAVAAAADSLLAGGHLTAAGVRFVQALRDEVGGWLGEAVDPLVARLAAGANAEHRARWRLRNLALEPDALTAAIDAWRQGRPAPAPDPVLRTGSGRALERSNRLDLVHRLLRDPDHVGGAADGTPPPARGARRGPAGTAGGEGDQGLQPGGGVRPGDLAYLGGEAGTALDAYRKELESLSRPASADLPPTARELEIWAGIALVSPRKALRERPETVRAVRLAAGDVDLDTVATWLEGPLD